MQWQECQEIRWNTGYQRLKQVSTEISKLGEITQIKQFARIVGIDKYRYLCIYNLTHTYSYHTKRNRSKEYQYRNGLFDYLQSQE